MTDEIIIDIKLDPAPRNGSFGSPVFVTGDVEPMEPTYYGPRGRGPKHWIRRRLMRLRVRLLGYPNDADRADAWFRELEPRKALDKDFGNG